VVAAAAPLARGAANAVTAPEQAAAHVRLTEAVAP
jgi:hypothetical protein